MTGATRGGDRRRRAFLMTVLLLLPRVELFAQQQAAIERVSMESVAFALRSKGTAPCPHCGGRLRLIATQPRFSAIRLAMLDAAQSSACPCT